MTSLSSLFYLKEWLSQLENGSTAPRIALQTLTALQNVLISDTTVLVHRNEIKKVYRALCKLLLLQPITLSSHENSFNPSHRDIKVAILSAFELLKKPGHDLNSESEANCKYSFISSLRFHINEIITDLMKLCTLLFDQLEFVHTLDLFDPKC